MITLPMEASRAAPVTTGVEDLLNEARRSSVVVLGLRIAPGASTHQRALLNRLEVGRPLETPMVQLSGNSELPGTGNGQDPVPPETRAWIEAADLYEKAVAAAEAGGNFDFVFCLDPWAAFILRRDRDLWPEATWVYVSDLSARKVGQESDYWAEVEKWVQGLPIDHVLRIESILSAEEAGQLPIQSRALPLKGELGRIADLRTFRRVFADPDEHLILALLPKDSSCPLETLSKAADHAARSNIRVRWIVFTDEPIPGEAVASLCPLDLSAVSLLPELANIADALVLGAPISRPLPIGLPILIPSAAGGAPGFNVPGAASFDLGSAESLLSALPARLGLTKQVKNSASIPRSTKKSGEFILYNEWGIGDELLLSAVAREVARTWPDTRLWIRSRYGFRFPDFVRKGEPPRTARRVETIYQNAILYGPEAHSPFPGHLVQQMLDKFFLDTGLYVEARDVRPELLFGNGGLPQRRPRSVVLHSRPNPRLPSKDWGLARWERLADILHSSNVTTVQIGAPDEPLLPHVEDLRRTPLGEVPEIVSQSAVTVCLVGFLMHAAAATRTPAVVIYGGREHPAIDGYPDQVHLSSGPLPCRGRWGCHLGPEISCPQNMRCMDDLTPELVAGEVLRILDSQPAQVPA